ncbi:MAG: hypothetical protein K9K67_06340 [Bacteriovoracaceae bacterium]|nr:hypothetical protein [Bacteriovoracaceae bacterium]
MLLKIITIFTLFMVSINAKEFSYRYGQKSYVVQYDEETLGLKSVDINLTIKASKCFQNHYKDLYRQLSTLLKESVIPRNGQEKDILLNYENNDYRLSKNSTIGQRVLEVPRSFIQYKLMEKKQCGLQK